MTIHVPRDIERSINAAVQSGMFASADDAIAEAWQYFQRQRMPHQAETDGPAPDFDPILGSASDHAELVDEIVETAMQRREQRPLRLNAILLSRAYWCQSGSQSRAGLDLVDKYQTFRVSP